MIKLRKILLDIRLKDCIPFQQNHLPSILLVAVNLQKLGILR